MDTDPSYQEKMLKLIHEMQADIARQKKEKIETERKEILKLLDISTQLN